MNAENWNTDSLLAFEQIPHDSDEGVMALESVAARRLAAAESQYHPFAVQAFTNMAYLLGNHMVQFYFSPTNGFGIHRFGTHDTNRYDSLLAKSADNRIIRAVESVVAMVTSQQPEPRVLPNSELPEDEDAADLSGLVLRLVFEKPLQLPELLREAALLACTTHLVAAETEYGETDLPIEVPRYKTVKVPNPLYEEGDPEQESEVDAQEVDGFETVYKRDIQCRLWSSFHIRADPTATSPRNAGWFSRTSIEDLDWIIDNYAKDEEGYFFKPSDREELRRAAECGPLREMSLYWWDRIRDIIESPQYYGFGISASEQAPNQTTFSVIDVRPCKKYPRGRTLVFAGSRLIYAGDARAWTPQYPWRWHPYSFFGWFTVPGRMLKVPLVSQILPLQKKINAIDALVQANRQYMAFGQWFLPKSAKVQEGRIGGMPGEQYVWQDTGGAKPERVKNDPLPAELLTERAQLVQAIDYHAAVWVTPEGQIAPSANRAGVMLDQLRRERLTSKQPMLRQFEAFIESIAQNVLIELQTNLIEEDPELTARLQVAAREYSSLTIDQFVGQSLRDHHSVKIDIVSGLMSTEEARAEKALNFLQYSAGQVSPPERRAVLEATGLSEFVKNPENASVERARRIVSRIRTGQLDQLFQMPGESAAAMLPVFVDEVLSDRFHDLKPQQKQLLLAYQQTYQQIVQQQQQEQLKLQMMLQGGGKAPAEKPAR